MAKKTTTKASSTKYWLCAFPESGIVEVTGAAYYLGIVKDTIVSIDDTPENRELLGKNIASYSLDKFAISKPEAEKKVAADISKWIAEHEKKIEDLHDLKAKLVKGDLFRTQIQAKAKIKDREDHMCKAYGCKTARCKTHCCHCGSNIGYDGRRSCKECGTYCYPFCEYNHDAKCKLRIAKDKREAAKA